MPVATVRITGIWASYAGKHEPKQHLDLVSTRLAQENLYVGIVEETEGDYAVMVLVDEKFSTLNAIMGNKANADDVKRESEQPFAFSLPVWARRVKGNHRVKVMAGHMNGENFVPTVSQEFTVNVMVPESED